MDGFEIHVETARSAVSRVEDFSQQPCRRDGIRGFPHRSDNGIRTTVRVCHLGAWTPSPSMDRRHDQSNGGMAGPPDYRSLSLGYCFRALSSVTMTVPMAR